MAKLGELLVEEGLITPAALEAASKQKDAFLGGVLVRQGAIDEDKLVRVLERLSGAPVIDLEKVELDPGLADAVPFSFCQRYRCVPVHRDDASIYIGVVDPTNVIAWDELAGLLDLSLRTFTVRETQLERAWKRIYGDAPKRAKPRAASNRMSSVLESAAPPPIVAEDAFDVEKLTALLEEVEVLSEEDDEGYDVTAAVATDSPTVKLVNGFIYEAVERGASDIHLEPLEDVTRVRYRIDGVLRPRVDLPRARHRMVVSRVKIMAQLDISERRLPQDGRVRMKIGEKPVDLRISTMPVTHGEKVVVRVLGGTLVKESLEGLSMRARDLDRLRRAISTTNGMVLVTGPTGSGKTTTLYTILKQLNGPEVNVVTVEDPVEYELRGIGQLHVKPSIGLTFASALRAFLRQDPDIIMVGEIRDAETAEVAVKSALTGHLVLSTLHTNDSIWTVARLIDMGVPPFLVAAAVRCIVAQRLVRKLCPHCKVIAPEADHDAFERATGGRRASTMLFAARGCGACGGIGFKGRVPVFELFTVDHDDVKRIVADGARREALMDAARADGMKTLVERALEHVEEGITTLGEAWACCGM